MKITSLGLENWTHLVSNHPTQSSRAQQVAKTVSLVALAIILGALMSLGLFALGCPLAAAIPLGIGICITGIGLVALAAFAAKKLKAKRGEPAIRMKSFSSKSSSSGVSSSSEDSSFASCCPDSHESFTTCSSRGNRGDCVDGIRNRVGSVSEDRANAYIKEVCAMYGLQYRPPLCN